MAQSTNITIMVTPAFYFLKYFFFNNTFIFGRISNVILFVRFTDRPNQNNLYVNHETMSIPIPSGTTYIGLLNIVLKDLKLRPKNHTIIMKYVVELGTTPVKILDDLTIDF